jgi:hypothetical protein
MFKFKRICLIRELKLQKNIINFRNQQETASETHNAAYENPIDVENQAFNR